jgi:phenylalanyl-tRNA synthetase beta chain
LERSGIRAISALVDVTNYVMLELGQPLHAFDNTKLEGAVHARMAKPEEKLLLLNEQTIAIDSRHPGHCRRRQAAWPWPGSWAARRAVSRWKPAICSWNPPSLRRRQLPAVHVVTASASDASHRFERGVDFGGTRACH